jgi:hypothetical protein
VFAPVRGVDPTGIEPVTSAVQRRAGRFPDLRQLLDESIELRNHKFNSYSQLPSFTSVLLPTCFQSLLRMRYTRLTVCAASGAESNGRPHDFSQLRAACPDASEGMRLIPACARLRRLGSQMVSRMARPIVYVAV